MSAAKLIIELDQAEIALRIAEILSNTTHKRPPGMSAGQIIEGLKQRNGDIEFMDDFFRVANSICEYVAEVVANAQMVQ